ncbi:hypothetical protein UY3_04797 [Chelonia mydas]|uniref:DUF4549 domain-containing protein n=1 Tax=Chelonia mydas TaxID=8469 RepID=M7C0Z5_CHEMY|nr:hypothetical protein UY3_04797 [Chelonia mydas]
MDEFYKISSTERVQQLEKELAAQLAELKKEIEDNGVLQGTPDRSYSSVPIPKDASYFRKEREVILKKGLQRGELISTGDHAVPESQKSSSMDRTGALCVDSINGLSHNRDADFGDEEDEEEVEAQQASGETIFPDSQELFFTPDLVPSQPTEGRLLDLEGGEGSSGPLGKDAVFTLPQHTTETEELKPQLQLLLSHFGVCYDTENLKNSANEMELFSLVIRKFRSVFSKQQTMRTFPVYDAGVPGSENWGILGPSMVLKKRANWIPFIKIKPKQDPWQQKLLTKLKQWKKVDELLHLQSKFLEDQNIEDNNPAVAMNEKGMETISLSKNPGSSRKKKERGYSYVTTLQLLGLDEGTEANNKDLIMRKGAYLSVLYLRHLRIRDLQVHSAQFMEFSEVENHDDFYTTQDGYIHTQDQRGAYIMYDVALKDLKDLENQLLLVASQYIEQDKSHVTYHQSSDDNLLAWAHASVDRFAVLLDIWTCEAALLENKRQLLDGYFEAYQHALDTEERFALAQAITDIMHKRPRFDLSLRYFVNTYNDECICLRLQLQLVREICNQHIDAQREYVQKIWRKDQTGGISEFGLPHNIIAKQLISLNNNCPTLKNIYLLEFHPSLGLASLIPKALEYVSQEFYNICRPKTPSEATSLEKQVLQLAVDEWLTMEKPESSYSSQIQKDVGSICTFYLFADTLLEDPLLVRDIAMLALESGTDEEKKQGREKQAFILDIFSRLLELITLRHRLIETALESAQLARMYKAFAGEMGFDEFHLYLRPVHFEFASHKEKADQPPPIFITSLLEDDSSVDRYIPSNLLLSIQEIDNNQIGKFSFHTRDGVIQLLSQFGVENMQITLACQVTQKNALIVAVQQASFCHVIRPTSTMDMKVSSISFPNPIGPPEAFVSIQLEKLGPRDMMLNTFIHKKEIMGSRMQNPAAYRALRQSLQIVAALHDIVSYLFSFAQLGNSPNCFDSLNPEPLTADWGGNERIAIQLCTAQRLSSWRSDYDSTLTLFPWRAFLVDGGPFPVTISNLNTINYNMQLCLCRLSDDDRRVAHGALVGMPSLMEDMLRSSYGVVMEDHAEWQTAVAKKKQNLAEIDESHASGSESSRKTCKALPRLHDPVTSRALLRSFLITWKQLEVLKAEWGRLKLKVEDINTVPLYKQFAELYGTDILYPAMRAIARHMGTEDEFEGLVTSSQSILPPKGASEIEVKTRQLQKLLESLEIHMIHDAKKKINQEMTLVTSERARAGSGLPTELWKHRVMQENFSVVRPQIVETFVQRLMENYQESDVEIAELSHEMIMEITALRARLTNLEKKNLCLKEEIRKEVQDEYETLVQNLFVTCLHLKGKLDDYRLNMSRQVFEIISEVRKEGVDNMIDLKKKFGSTKDDDGLKVHLSKQEQLQFLQDENTRLHELVCKLKVLSCWKQTIQKAQLSVKLRNAEKDCATYIVLVMAASPGARSGMEALQNKEECLNAKMLAEQEVFLFRQQLVAVRKALAKSQADNERLKKQLDKQKHLLQEVEHRMTQEARSRQQLDVMKAANMEKMLEDMGQKEQRLQCLTEDAEKSSRIVQLQQKRIKKEMRQIRSQLIQERSLKLDAFQRVDELQYQVYDLEAVTSQRNSPAGSASWAQRTVLSASTLPRDYKQNPLTPDPKGSNITSGKTERPKTVSNGGFGSER